MDKENYRAVNWTMVKKKAVYECIWAGADAVAGMDMVAYSDGLVTVACCHGGTSPTDLVDNRHYHHLLFSDDFLRIRIAWTSTEMIFGGYSSGKARDRT
jgi:hypothetical protein